MFLFFVGRWFSNEYHKKSRTFDGETTVVDLTGDTVGVFKGDVWGEVVGEPSLNNDWKRSSHPTAAISG